MNLRNFETYEIHAEFCRVLANPKRLMVINLLKDKKLTVGELATALDLTVSNVSQHLKVMKNYQILSSEKVGHKVYYFLTDQRLVKTCEKIREIISDLYTKRGNIFNSDSS